MKLATWAVIFDWDGVVVDSSRAHEASWQQVAREAGRVFPEESFTRGFGMKNETIISQLLAWTHDPHEIRRLSLRKEALYREIIRTDGLTVLPGVRELLTALRLEQLARLVCP